MGNADIRYSALVSSAHRVLSMLDATFFCTLSHGQSFLVPWRIRYELHVLFCGWVVGFSFWQIGVFLRSQIVMSFFCTFDCLRGRDFCMTCTHTCADVHGL